MAHRYTNARLTCYQELARALKQHDIPLQGLMRCALDHFLEDFPNIRALYGTRDGRVTVSKRVLRQLERTLADQVDALKLARQLRYLARFGDRIPPIEHVSAKRWPNR